MKVIIILLLSLCHLPVKANDHSRGLLKQYQFGHARADVNKQNSQLTPQDKLSGETDFIINNIEDEDSDWVSARKYTLLVKSPLIHFFSTAFADFHTRITSRLQCRQSADAPTCILITQRVLRI